MSHNNEGGPWLLFAVVALGVYVHHCRVNLPVTSKEIQRELVILTAREERRSSPFPFSRDLIHAVVKQESNYNHRAVSRSGAKGYMQLLDSTGREWHRKLGIRESYDPFNKRQNITIGTHYLKHLVEYYGGDVPLALTAYNQGYGRVDSLLRKHKAKSLQGIINDLGPDGRSYARNVLSIASRVSG